ncbi:MAG: REP-associated tyrosine transposase [Lutispora sp.]|jgi:putative transposase|nr:hypothetical protein [Clostridiales bacterium]
MPRKARVQSSTDYYHIMMRGNNRESIFSRDEQKSFFLDSLEKQQDNQLIHIVAFCLMNNHVHIVVKAEPSNLAKAIKSVNIRYAMYFNQTRSRIGHVFQDRYKSEPIEDDKYLIQVIRYVHNNPVKAKLVKSPEEYRWSSFNEYLSDNVIISSLQKKFILGLFSSDIKQFVEFHNQKDNNEYLDINEELERNRLEYAQEIISSYFNEKGLKEAKQLTKNSIHLEELIRRLLKSSKLSHRQIANLLGISSSIVHRVNLNK